MPRLQLTLYSLKRRQFKNKVTKLPFLPYFLSKTTKSIHYQGYRNKQGVLW